MHRQLSFREACEYLRIPEEVLRKAAKYGEIPSRKAGEDLLFDEDALDAWGSRRILGLRRKDLGQEHVHSTRLEAEVIAEDVLFPALLKPAYINLDFRAKTRTSVLHDLVDMAEAQDLLYNPVDLFAQLAEREAFSSTALPGGIALPHPHHQDPYLIVEPFMLVARTQRPVWFGAEDDSPTDLFCLLCCGENMRHLHVLARLCMMIRDTALLDALRSASTAQEAQEAILSSEREVLSNMR